MKKLLEKFRKWRGRHTYAKKLALATREGRIWWSFNVPKELVPMVFMPIKLGCEIPKDSVGCYGYDSDAIGDRGINGYPMLSAIVFVTQAESELVQKYEKKLTKKIKNL